MLRFIFAVAACRHESESTWVHLVNRMQRWTSKKGLTHPILWFTLELRIKTGTCETRKISIIKVFQNRVELCYTPFSSFGAPDK